MVVNEVKEFFDQKAISWDSKELKTKDDLIKYIDLIDLKHTDNVLDLGCGTGIISGLLKERVNKVVAMDISSKMIEIAKSKYPNSEIKFVNDDFYKTSLNCFDKVVIFNAYPHFLDKESFKNKLYDVLSKNGEFYIIHSLSRKELENFHRNAQNVSFILAPALNEKDLFLDKFDILECIEEENLYLIKGRKREE